MLLERSADSIARPTADDRETWLPTMRHIASKAAVFVLSACQVLRRPHAGGIPNALGEAPQTLLMRGGSCIIDPAGKSSRARLR